MPIVFETLRSYQGSFWRLDDHWARWQTSAELCGYTLPMSFDVWKKSLLKKTDKPKDYRYRSWTDGKTWNIERLELPAENYEAGVSIIDATFTRHNPAAKHSSHDYAYYQKLAADSGAFDVISFDQHEVLTEGNITNVFMVKDSQIWTPPSENILAGLMRQWVLDNATVKVAAVTKAELNAADEIFLTNMVRGVVPVKRWDKWRASSLGTGQGLRQQWKIKTRQIPNNSLDFSN